MCRWILGRRGPPHEKVTRPSTESRTLQRVSSSALQRRFVRGRSSPSGAHGALWSGLPELVGQSVGQWPRRREGLASRRLDPGLPFASKPVGRGWPHPPRNSSAQSARPPSRRSRREGRGIRGPWTGQHRGTARGDVRSAVNPWRRSSHLESTGTPPLASRRRCAGHLRERPPCPWLLHLVGSIGCASPSDFLCP